MRTLAAHVLLVALALSPPALAAGQVYELRVDGLACPFCAYGIEKKLLDTQGVTDVDVSINEGIVRVTVRDQADLDEARAREIVKNAGFTLRKFTPVKPVN